MPHPVTNTTRRDAAALALAAHNEGNLLHDGTADVTEEAVVYLLTDLIHLCDLHGINHVDAWHQATAHHEKEILP